MNEQVRMRPSPILYSFGDMLKVLSLNVSIGGGSASDSGRSIASSVSTEPFFSGQSVTVESQLAIPSESNTTQNVHQTPTESEVTASANNNEEPIVLNAIEPTTSNVAALHPEETNESQDTNEIKDPESASNDDNTENNDVINVYSSGDEGDFLLILLLLDFSR